MIKAHFLGPHRDFCVILLSGLENEQHKFQYFNRSFQNRINHTLLQLLYWKWITLIILTWIWWQLACTSAHACRTSSKAFFRCERCSICWRSIRHTTSIRGLDVTVVWPEASLWLPTLSVILRDSVIKNATVEEKPLKTKMLNNYVIEPLIRKLNTSQQPIRSVTGYQTLR